MAIKLLGPAQTVRMRTEADVTARVERRAAADGQQVRLDRRTLVAYVSEGRWVADCPGCRAGIAIHPEWTTAACLGVGCYRLYTSIAVPTDWVEIETALDVRDKVNQNALPGETAAALEVENEIHRGEIEIARGERIR